MSSDLQASNPADKNHAPSHVSPDTHHVVKFYETDEYLLLMLSQFVTTTIESGQASVVVGTSDHMKRLDEMLLSNGFDVAASKASGQFVPLDTASIMPQFMVAGEPDSDPFQNLFGSKIGQSQASWPYVRIFGEMVALTAEIDYATATVDLEHHWNDLLKKYGPSSRKVAGPGYLCGFRSPRRRRQAPRSRSSSSNPVDRTENKLPPVC